MADNFSTWEEANNALKEGYPNLSKKDQKLLKQAKNRLKENSSLSPYAVIPSRLGEFLKPFPFSEYLMRVWITDDRYPDHGPRVLRAMNILLSDNPGDVIKSDSPDDLEKEKRHKATQVGRVATTIDRICRDVGRGQRGEKVDALFRLAALYHDIGKYIIKERHPTIGWYIAQYINTEEKDKLRSLLGEDDFRLLMIILRDHDHLGVLGTGEASLPILLNAVSSGESLETQKRIVSALALCNLADMVGTFEVDGEATDRLIDDWQWFLGALEHCSKNRLRLDEYLIQEASRIGSEWTAWESALRQDRALLSIPCVSERVRRLLTEASRKYPSRRRELDNEQLITTQLQAVFGTRTAMKEFSSQFTYICKLDYGKRFFEALINYCEGCSGGSEERDRISTEKVIYAVFAILKRITATYAVMIRSESELGNLIGVELKDLTPENAPTKTERIIELIITSHYPGLTWMMSDAPAWYF